MIKVGLPVRIIAGRPLLLNHITRSLVTSDISVVIVRVPRMSQM